MTRLLEEEVDAFLVERRVCGANALVKDVKREDAAVRHKADTAMEVLFILTFVYSMNKRCK